MPTINEWQGDAPKQAQVTELLCPDLVGAVEFYIGGCPLGWARNWRTAASGAEPAVRTAALVSFWNSSPLGEFAEISATSESRVEEGYQHPREYLILRAREAGRPFVVTTTLGGGTGRSNEVQQVTVLNATGGTFPLAFNGQSAGDIAFSASAATFQAALEGTSNIAPGDISVTKEGNTWTIVFLATYEGTNVPLITASDAGLTGGTCEVLVTPVQTGVLPINAVQVVSLPGIPTGGTADLSLDGIPFGPLAFNANAATCQSAAEAALGAGNVTCSGSTLTAGITFTFQGAYSGQVMPLISGDGSSLTGGVTYLTAGTTTQGSAGTNTSLRWALTANPGVADGAGRTGFRYRFRVTCPGGGFWQSAELSYTDSASVVQSALEDLFYLGYQKLDQPFAGLGNVTVTGTLNNTWTTGYMQVDFAGLWASCEVQLTILTTTGGSTQPWDFNYSSSNNSSVSCPRTVVAAGARGVNEVQTLTRSGSPAPGLTFQISHGGHVSDPISYGATAYEIESALARMISVGAMGEAPEEGSIYYGAAMRAPIPNPLVGTGSFQTGVLVTGELGVSPVSITFRGAGVQSVNLTQLSVQEAAQQVVVQETQSGVPGLSEIQEIYLTGSPWGGTFPLTYSGQTTSSLPHNVTSAALRTAFEALSNLAPGDLTVSGLNPWRVTFHPTLGHTSLISGNGSGLKNGRVTTATITDGGISVTQRTIARSRGPWHGDDPLNWTLGHVLQSGEQPHFIFGETGPRWGITWLADCTRDAIDSTLLLVSGDFVEGQAVEVRSSGTLPTGLSANTVYFVRDRDHDAGTLRLAATAGGTPISVSGGSGTHELFVRLTGLKTLSTWKGWIGTTIIEKSGKFREYRPLYLSCGWSDNATITLGEGKGSSSPLVHLRTFDWPVTLELLSASGSVETDLPAVLWVGDHDGNSIEILKGSLGVAVLTGETARLGTIIQRDGTLKLGAGVTIDVSGAKIDQTGGKLNSLATFNGRLILRS